MDQDNQRDTESEPLISRNPWIRVLTYIILSFVVGAGLYLLLSDYTLEGLQAKEFLVKGERYAIIFLSFATAEVWFWIALIGSIVVTMFIEKTTYNFKPIEDEPEDDGLE